MARSSEYSLSALGLTLADSISTAFSFLLLIVLFHLTALEITRSYSIHIHDNSTGNGNLDLRVGLNKGHPTTPIPKTVRPSQRKGIQSTKTKFVRSVIREVAGFSAYERRVMELLRNSKDKKARKLTKKRLGTLLRSKRKLEELGTIIQESRRAAH
ncbi:ribosomal protein L36e-domain-containing protein [Lentinula detonsa]|uniref:Ribosomal protein L36e-domain-containing protein n=1 Tax=Lentinula detonsa TaxID=2804962 RepID=A0AA38UWQ1_9AGAR|nr:ribosomal protein L36e-domain-containing protein [Lentinula detonsa]